MLPVNWVDAIGMKVNAAFLNTLGTTVNAVVSALSGKKLWVGTEAEFTAIGTKDPDTIYFRTA